MSENIDPKFIEKFTTKLQAAHEAGDKALSDRLMFGYWLRSLRLNRGRTQEQAFEAIDSDKSTWSKYETGDMLPDEETCFKIADAFDIIPDEIQIRAGYPGGKPLEWDEHGDPEKETLTKLKNAIQFSKDLSQFLIYANTAWCTYNQYATPMYGTIADIDPKKPVHRHLKVDLNLINSVVALSRLPGEEQVELFEMLLINVVTSKGIRCDMTAREAVKRLFPKLTKEYS